MTDLQSKILSINDDELKNMNPPRTFSENPHTPLECDFRNSDGKAREIEACNAPCADSYPTTQESTPTSTRPTFLSLPTEIRDQISKYIITPTSGTIDLKTSAGKPNLNLTLINKQIRSETLYILHNDIPLNLSFWNYPRRKQKIQETTASQQNILKSLWRKYCRPRSQEQNITHQSLTLSTSPHEKTHAIGIPPPFIANFRKTTITIPIDQDVFLNPALKQGIVSWLQNFYPSTQTQSHNHRRINLDFTYSSDASAFRYNWYILRARHPRGDPLFTKEAIESCFRNLLSTWRDCHVGVCQMMGELGDGVEGVDVDVVVRNVDEIDGFRFEVVEEGEMMEGRFVDGMFDERLCSGVDGGQFSFSGRELRDLKCNYRQRVA